MTTRHHRWAAVAGTVLTLAITGHAVSAQQKDWSPGPASWKGDLTPITAADWSYDRAEHLLGRAGFSGTPDEIQKLADMTPAEAVRSLVHYDSLSNDHLEPFEHSGFFDDSLADFPPSRPAATELAMERGESMGIRVKPEGVNRHMQPVSDRFFYWLRATGMEARRVGYWWAERMLDTHRPLQEKLALFWHGHFATAEGKVRDYRKMLGQVEMFERHAAGNFGDLAEAVAKDPGMLYYLDAGVNVKGAANENFAREVMELFTMGVGNYSEQDVREAARAFTGWNYDNLDFVVNAELHDDGEKTFLGRTGNFDGVDVLNIILEQPVTAEYIAAKLYRFFVRDDPGEVLTSELGALFRDADYELRPLLTTVFLSRDFYSEASYGAHIKGPVEHVITLLNQLGAEDVPGVPDFNSTTTGLGQQLLNPPSVAGWAQGQSWITPALLQRRGNVAFDFLFPGVVGFRDPNFLSRGGDGTIGERLRSGQNFTSAIALDPTAEQTAFNMAARERDELFNTRVSGYRAWATAMQKLIPTPRGATRVDMTRMVLDTGATTTTAAVDHLLGRFLRMPVSEDFRTGLIQLLGDELGTDDLRRAETYLEDPLRMVAHLIMSTPEYQID
ncbi:MAG: DUF1800 domain-containing protein [Vicinamibacterales bacterium]|jgi:uncharacterized protein (DUF1800 family)|nr:DUF1800 domain-containing protein [Vicinamibacterales bacterium]HJN42842.1 DUF1800 domain-containing protein [Vicinamibacterales bacterium]